MPVASAAGGTGDPVVLTTTAALPPLRKNSLTLTPTGVIADAAPKARSNSVNEVRRTG